MSELAVTTNLARLNPPVFLQLSDDVPLFHGANLSTGCNGRLTVLPGTEGFERDAWWSPPPRQRGGRGCR
jgi:hypothetical protein